MSKKHTLKYLKKNLKIKDEVFVLGIDREGAIGRATIERVEISINEETKYYMSNNRIYKLSEDGIGYTVKSLLKQLKAIYSKNKETK